MAVLASWGCKLRPTPEARYSDARLKFQQGQIDTAIDLSDQNYRELAAGNPIWSWKFRVLEADMLLWRGAPAGTLALLEGTPPTNSPLEIIARREILKARALCRLGDGDRAQVALSRARDLIPTLRRDLRAELAFARAKCSGDSRTALAFYRETAEFAHGIDSFNEANALIYIGYSSLQDGHYEDAITQFRKALTLSDSLLLLKEKALGNLGYSYSQLGEFGRAISNSGQAENLAAELAGLNRKEAWIKTEEMKWLIDLGQEHFSQLEYTEAASSFSKALSIAGDVRDSDGTAICLNNLAQVALRTNDLKSAEDYTNRLEELKPKGSHLLDLLLDEAELAKGKGDLPAAELLLRQLLERMANQQGIEPFVRWTAQSDLAAVYAAEGKFGLADNMFRQAVATAEAARKKIEGVEYRISFLDQSPFYDRYVKFLMSRKRFLEALDVAELGRSPTLAEGLEPGERKSLRGPRLQIIQQRLRAQHSIVLAYWLGWEKSYLWAITPSQIKPFLLPRELEIEKEAAAYNREIVDREPPEKSHSGEKLYNVLIRPAAALIPKGWNVIIVPHRKLYNLNFETILVPDPKPHYWIEDVRLQNASFLSALASHERPASQNTAAKLLLIGAPVLAEKKFPVLKYAASEMEKVASHFPSPQETVIAGDQATPQAYLSNNPGQFNLLHFVTHGTSSTVLESPLDSAIILSPAQGNSAPAGDPEGSYHLYGKDIMKKPLHAELVTISACYGLGREFSGEGLVGLAWAFMRAGAHQVIAALWEVDDASTPQLMDDFYTELSQGKSAAEALRDAKLKMLHSSNFHRHPYYWASLQLYTGS